MSKYKKYEIIKNQSVFAPVQQGLANDNPDVDAIYRMVNKSESKNS